MFEIDIIIWLSKTLSVTVIVAPSVPRTRDTELDRLFPPQPETKLSLLKQKKTNAIKLYADGWFDEPAQERVGFFDKLVVVGYGGGGRRWRGMVSQSWTRGQIEWPRG